MADHTCLECGNRLSVADAGWFCAKCGTWWDDYMISVMHKVDARARANERERVRDFVMKRMGHCGDCAKVDAWETGADPNTVECDCAYDTVEGLFAESESVARGEEQP